MSGDVQPRKRRDKKKKKDDLEETTAHHFHARAPTPPSTNDEVIHVYKEISTGGGICAKIVFFILLSILAVLIGLIITEHRGLTDLDTIETDTRFSQIFEGWVDKTPESHDDDAHHAIESHEHDDDHDEHDEHDDHDEEDDHDHEEDEDEHASEEDEEHDEDEEEEDAAASEVDDEEEPSEQQDDDDDDEDEEEKSEPEEDEDDVTAESEQPDDEDEDDDDDQQSAPASAEPQDDDDDDDEVKDSAGDDDDDDEKDGDDDDDEAADSKPQSAEAASDEKDDDDDDDNGDDDQQKSEEDNNDDDEENPETGDEDQPGEDAEGDDESNTGVVIKIGVGVTILVVAYVVLVRKWKSDNSNEDAKAEKKEIPVDLSRRNTIVVPPKVEEVEQVIDNDDEEYSEEEEEEIKLHPKLKQDYQQLRSTYERSLTPESDPETHGRSYDYEDEGEEDVEYDDEEAEDEENLEDEDEEADVDEEDEPISDVDDDDLLKKLEAKYGKLETTRADDEEEPEEEEEEEPEEEEEDDDDHYHWKRSKPSGAQAQPSEDEISHTAETPAPYEYENLTNDEDRIIKDELDEAHEHIETNAALAVSLFNNILRQHPASPRALYGKAKSLDNLADKQRSNELLKDAIATYSNLLKMSKVPSALFVAAGERCVDRMRFIGQYGRASVVHNALITRFPDEIKYRNQLAVTYLMSNRINEAREILQKTLKRWPNDGFAQVHYGFILKVNEDKLKESIDYLRTGLRSKAEGVIDGRFYFHLGDALIRLGRPKEAAEVYNEGVANKVFLSFYQRSLYNVDRLTGRPWWEKSYMPQYKHFLDMLEKNFLAIKKEGLALLNEKGYFQDEAENLRDVGEWKQFELFARGLKNADHCRKCPMTCKIVESIPDATGCRRGQIKFSVMHPGTHVWPHCGPTNCRLRIHLGLKIPKNTFIRVAEETRSWEEGKLLIFDDSFEHEVWHNGTETRLVLIVDVWHPELTRMEKQSLSAI